MTAVGAFASVAAFLWAFWFLGIGAEGAKAIRTAREAFGQLADKTMTDDAREAAVRVASLRLLRASTSILVRSVGALLVAGLPILAVDQAGIVDSSEMLRFLSRWDVIIGLSATIILAYVAFVFYSRRKH